MCIASVMEFAGAMLVGSRVTDTIRTKVISTKLFEDVSSIPSPQVQPSSPRRQQGYSSTMRDW